MRWRCAWACSRPIPLRLHRRAGQPGDDGLFSSRWCLLPASLLSGMPVPLLEALLAHELAHVRRWDYLVNLLQSVAEALLFFHPVVWWLSARMRVERELVADALAAQSLAGSAATGQRAAPAVLAAGSAAPPGLLLSARGGTLACAHPAPDGARAHADAGPGRLEDWRARLAAGRRHLAGAGARGSPRRRTRTCRAAQHAGACPSTRAICWCSTTPAGKVLMAKDADAIVPIASITKLMTAMVVLDARLDPD